MHRGILIIDSTVISTNSSDRVHQVMIIMINLHNTVMLTLLCTVSTTLVTVQPYSTPISSLTIFIIVRSLVTWYTSLTTIEGLVSLITYLPSVKLLPSVLLQLTDGIGAPVAVQVIVTLSPSLTLTIAGVVAVGWAIMVIIIHKDIYAFHTCYCSYILFIYDIMSESQPLLLYTYIGIS